MSGLNATNVSVASPGAATNITNMTPNDPGDPSPTATHHFGFPGIGGVIFGVIAFTFLFYLCYFRKPRHRRGGGIPVQTSMQEPGQMMPVYVGEYVFLGQVMRNGASTNGHGVPQPPIAHMGPGKVGDEMEEPPPPYSDIGTSAAPQVVVVSSGSADPTSVSPTAR